MATYFSVAVSTYTQEYLSTGSTVEPACVSLGTRIEERLKVVGISQSELGRRADVPQTTLNGLIRKGARTSPHLLRIARVLGTTPAYLIGEVDDPLADAPEPPVFKPEHVKLIEFYEALGPVEQTALMTIASSMAGERPAGTLQAPARSYRFGGENG